jgi:hypothetical protein
MVKPLRILAPLAVLALLALPSVAMAWHEDDPRSTNQVPLGHSPEPAGANFNSDIAFWRNYAVEGAYDGFRIVDISNPRAPVEVSDVICGAAGQGTSSQGDITVSPDGNILVRSQDSARILPGNNVQNACDPGTAAPPGTPGGTLQQGWEGLQIFDISNKAAPRFITAVFTDFGSHTHTQYYDRANNRLIIYVSRGGSREGSATGYQAAPANPYGGQNWPAGNGCITAVEVPLANPAGARVVNRCIAAGWAAASVTAGGCHDVMVYEGLRRLYGACRPNMILWDISDPVNPRVLHEHGYPGIMGWHSAAMSWNGQYLYAGWEPGGGSAPRCQATGAPLTDPPTAGNVQTDAMKTIFAYRARDGVLAGRWVLPQEQSNLENCTIHNYALAPYVDRHILVGDGYQAGNFTVDYTNPSNPRQLAFTDPPPWDADPATPGVQSALVGEWSTHWYNDLIYSTDIPQGIAVWDITEPWWETHSVNLPALNPQTMTEQLRCRVSARGSFRAGRSGVLRVSTTVNGQRIAGLNVRARGAGVNRRAETNASGAANLTLRPRRAGTLRVNVGELNVVPCSASRRVAAAPRAGGVRGGATGGAGLTGRYTR